MVSTPHQAGKPFCIGLTSTGGEILTNARTDRGSFHVLESLFDLLRKHQIVDFCSEGPVTGLTGDPYSEIIDGPPPGEPGIQARGRIRPPDLRNIVCTPATSRWIRFLLTDPPRVFRGHEVPNSKEQPMARYTGPKVRLSRRLGVPIADIPKHTAKRQLTPPGLHGMKHKRVRDYGVRLNEK
ncbi:MAG: hypothetical protein CBC49_000605, partial [Alphaproteobacteria bacterium TMED89]